MKLPALLLALFLSLYGCASTPPPAAPVEIDPPPVALMTACPSPADLPDLATARELADSLVDWIKFAGCERGKRVGLLNAWPR